MQHNTHPCGWSEQYQYSNNTCLKRKPIPFESNSCYQLVLSHPSCTIIRRSNQTQTTPIKQQPTSHSTGSLLLQYYLDTNQMHRHLPLPPPRPSIPGARRSTKNPGRSRSHSHGTRILTHTHTRMTSHKMRVDPALIHYITHLERNIALTKVQILEERQKVVDTVMNVARLAGEDQVTQEQILAFIGKVSVEEGELENSEGTHRMDWFEMLQEHRFKNYLYGGPEDQKAEEQEEYQPLDNQQQRKKPKKSAHEDLGEMKKRKKYEHRKFAASTVPALGSLSGQSSLPGIGPVPGFDPLPSLLPRSNEAPRVPTDYTMILKNVLNGQAIDMSMIGGFQKYINSDLTLQGPSSHEHLSKGE